MFQCVAVLSSVLQCVAGCASVCCSVLQCSIVHCNALTHSYSTEMLQQKMPGVVSQDLSLVLLWSNSPAPAVAQRIPLMMAVLALNRYDFFWIFLFQHWNRLWANSPAPATAQRNPLMMAVLVLNRCDLFLINYF